MKVKIHKTSDFQKGDFLKEGFLFIDTLESLLFIKKDFYGGAPLLIQTSDVEGQEVTIEVMDNYIHCEKCGHLIFGG